MRSFVAGVLLLVAAVFATAQGPLPVPPLSGRVVDQTGTLTPPQVEALTAKLAAIETQHGAQVVIVIVPTTAPEDVASFAQRVGEQWKVGRKDVGDGLILLVAKNDRAVQIQVAKALQGAVPDIAAGRIISQQIVPAFRNGDFAGGLNSAVDRIGERIASEGLPTPAQPRQGGSARRSGGFDLQTISVFLFIAVPILGSVLGRMMGRKLGALVTGVAVGGLGWALTASLFTALGIAVVAFVLVGVMGGSAARRGGGPVIWGGGGGFGGGGFGGGFGGGGGGGGGFSSGGGGSFDGGGASGRW
jgi:uncharacterized protein